MSDDAARQMIRHALDESLVVEAAAGTGKTTELVLRLVAVLGSGRTQVDRIVAVTFTRKAAGELKLRLRQGLDTARAMAEDPDEIRNLERALAQLEEARIGTIHSFCGDLLRARPVEAGIDPDFKELADEAGPRLFGRTFRLWMQEQLADPSPGLSRALSRSTLRGGMPGETPMDRISKAAEMLSEWRDFTHPWRREPFDLEGAVARLLPRVHALAELRRRSDNHKDSLWRSLKPVEDLSTWVTRVEREAPCDLDRLEGRLMRLHDEMRRNTFKGYGKLYAENLPRADVVTAREQLLASLELFGREADADLAPLLQQEMGELVQRYEAVKQSSGKLDFSDLLMLSRNLLRDNDTVRAFFQQRFSHIFVDEFQDTDPLQAEILLLLSADDPQEKDWRRTRPVPGKLFIVGDPKQSIYRFRRADVLFYQQVCDQLTAVGVARVQLTRSFRALPSIQQAINAAFASEMTGDRETGQPDYVALTPFREDYPGQPGVVALPVPRPYGKRGVTKGAISASLPDAVAAYVQWLVEESGWSVSDPQQPQRRIAIAPQHICLLFKRRASWGTDVTQAYARALEVRQIPHILVGTRSFHQREEVETLRAALTAIEWPDDALNVYATLRGSLFSLPDDLLLRYREIVKRLHPFRKVPDTLPEDLRPVAQALEILASLHRARNQRPIVATLHALLEATRARAGFGLRPAGDQVLANVQRVCDRARAFEMAGGISFRGFVDELISAADRGPAALEAPVQEDAGQEVRIMTVHSAKGLEFPVVILADIGCNRSGKQADRYIDPDKGLAAVKVLRCKPWELIENEALELRRDDAEGLRVAYVAATRARDLLVVPTIGERPQAGWLDALNKAVYPSRDDWSRPEPAPGCPAFGPSSALQLSGEMELGNDPTVAPGLHRPDVGEHRVVWWDPAMLTLDVAPRFGLRQEQILIEDDGGQAVIAGRARYESWQARKAAAIERGAAPLYQVHTATETEIVPPPVTVRCESLTPADPSRPSGRRFGTLVHTVLRDVPLDATTEGIARLAELSGRVLGAPDDERQAAAQSVAACLAHPLLRQAAGAARCHRELPVLAVAPEGELIEGTIDLAFEVEGHWTIVDFKVTADLALHQPAYEAQLAWYVHALTGSTGATAEAWLLGV